MTRAQEKNAMSLSSQLQDFFDELGLISHSEYKEYTKIIPLSLLSTIGFHYSLRSNHGHILVLNYYRDSDQLALAA